MQLLRDSDEGAFAEIYRRHWEKLAISAMKVIGSREDARDIVQEVFVSVWKRRHEIDVRISLPAYLMRSVRNAAIRYIQKNITRHHYLSTLNAVVNLSMANPAQDYESTEFRALVEKAVAALPPKMQEVYSLSRNENMSYKEIAEQMGIAENTVRKQLSNALKSLRTSVDKLSILIAASLSMHLF